MNRINLKLFSTPRKIAMALFVAVTLSANPVVANAGPPLLPAALNDNTKAADAGNVGVIKGLDDIKGQTIEDVRANAVESGKYPDDMTKIFFLYNVKTKKFINAGGFWGTHVVLADYPIALWVNIRNDHVIHFVQNMDTGEGHQLGWRQKYSNTYTDRGVFIDRKNVYGWKFETLNDAKNTYRIYTFYNETVATERCYLCANKGGVDQDKDCEGMEKKYIENNGLAGYDEWRVFSMQQIYDLQRNNTDDMTSSLDISFMLKSPGFSRGNKDIAEWKTSEFGKLPNGGIRFGLEKAYNLTPKVNSDNYDSGNNFTGLNSYTFNGRKFTTQDDYIRYMAKYFCTDAKSVRGVIYQDMKVVHGGSYVVECKGFSNTPKAKLFAVCLDKDGNELPRTLHQTVLSQISYMSAAEKAELHISEQNMDYAGKCFYDSHKYINSVLVQVPEPETGDYCTIRFGVIVGDDANDTTPVTGEWTVIDDFRLLYASKTIDEDLILDEDRKDLDYLVKCSNNYRNKVLHLKKTLVRDKWNSIVLPVSLTCDQLRQAFGAHVKLAKLSALTSNEIQFMSLNLDDLESTAVALEAYTPYIILPTKHIVPRGTPAYKALLTKTGATTSMSHEVLVAGDHIEIPNVTMATDADNKNDLSNMDTTTWTTKNMYSVSGNGTMEARGTFARTFGTEDTQNTDENSDKYGEITFTNRDIIPGRDNLIGSYFFDKGDMYSSNTRPRGLRGFSCWFKPTAGTQASDVRLFLDGIADGTATGINMLIEYGEEQPVGKVAPGIYTLSGQLVSTGSDTTGLPAGMYIVNGKKCVVK